MCRATRSFDVEEPAVVDLPRRSPPVHQAIDLRVEQSAEPVAAAVPAAEAGGGLAHRPRDLGHPGRELAQPGQGRLAPLAPAGERRRAPSGAAWKPTQGGDDLAELAAGRMVARQRLAAGLQCAIQHRWQRRRIQGKIVVEVANAGHALAALQRDLPPLDRSGEGSAEHREQDPASELALGRAPVDVEPARELRGRPVGENVVPGGVLAGGGHVIGDDVQHDPHAVRRERRVQRFQIRLGAELRINKVRVHHVVPVRASPAGTQDRRAVDVADAEPAQVRNEGARRGEGEAGVQLQAIGGTDRGHPISAAARDAAA